MHLGGPAEVSATMLRARGFVQAVDEARGTIDAATIDHISFDSALAAARARALLTDPAGPPDAIVCGSDLIASGVLLAARELGISVPGNLAVTGFDDLELATHTTPPLTSMRMPLKQLGTAAVSLLLDYPNGVSPRSVLLDTSILYRDSTEASPRQPKKTGKK